MGRRPNREQCCYAACPPQLARLHGKLYVLPGAQRENKLSCVTIRMWSTCCQTVLDWLLTFLGLELIPPILAARLQSRQCTGAVNSLVQPGHSAGTAGVGMHTGSSAQAPGRQPGHHSQELLPARLSLCSHQLSKMRRPDKRSGIQKLQLKQQVHGNLI